MRRGLKLDLEKIMLHASIHTRYSLWCLFSPDDDGVHETMVNLMCRLRHLSLLLRIPYYHPLYIPNFPIEIMCVVYVVSWWIIYVFVVQNCCCVRAFISSRLKLQLLFDNRERLSHPYLLNNHDIFWWIVAKFL